MMNKLNSRGPRALPCGTPDVTGDMDDVQYKAPRYNIPAGTAQSEMLSANTKFDHGC